MIIYQKNGWHHLFNLFRFDGSVFPRVAPLALLSAIVAGLVKYAFAQGFVKNDLMNLIMKDTIVWNGFSFLVGFMIVFRTSMAYARFWEGCGQLHRMRAEWMDSCACIFAFTKYNIGPLTKVQEDELWRFRQLLVRLFSLLHALALAEIEDSSSKMFEEIQAFSYDLIDPNSIDPQSLIAIKDSEVKVELVFQWIQQLIVEHLWTPQCDKIVRIPAPLLTRAFQEMSNGMVCFQEAIKVSSVPFPFPYAQTCDCLLVIHCMMTPLVGHQWFESHWTATLFTFIIVFIFWSLNSIATEIENPYGPDPNDIDCQQLQDQMNLGLRQLISPQQLRTPTLVAGFGKSIRQDTAKQTDSGELLKNGTGHEAANVAWLCEGCSLLDVWTRLAPADSDTLTIVKSCAQSTLVKGSALVSKPSKGRVSLWLQSGDGTRRVSFQRDFQHRESDITASREIWPLQEKEEEEGSSEEGMTQLKHSVLQENTDEEGTSAWKHSVLLQENRDEEEMSEFKQEHRDSQDNGDVEMPASLQNSEEKGDFELSSELHNGNHVGDSAAAGQVGDSAAAGQCEAAFSLPESRAIDVDTWEVASGTSWHAHPMV